VPESDERQERRAPDAPAARRARRLPRDVRQLMQLMREHWELTPLGRRALEEARGRTPERDQVSADPWGPVRCCWCEREIRPGDVVVPAADDRLMHDAPACRGEFERFIDGAPARQRDNGW
jgi:hypothetical protein